MPAPTRNRSTRKRRPVEDDIGMPAETMAGQPEIVPFYTGREPPPGLERVGDILRRRRLQRGDDLQQIADYLCIRKSFLIALEESDYDELPADAYVIGFLRSYAIYLGFDGADAINRYRGEMAGRRRKPALILPTPIPEGRTPSAFIMIGAAVVAIMIYVLWYGLSSGDRTAVNTPPALPTSSAPAAATIDSGINMNAPPPAATSALTAPVAPAPAVPASVTAPAPTAPAAASTADAPSPASHLTIRAEKESWVLVTDAKGKAILDHVMKPGETFALPDQDGLKLTTGNSGGITVLQDGKPMPKFSRDSSILHDVPLPGGKPK